MEEITERERMVILLLADVNDALTVARKEITALKDAIKINEQTISDLNELLVRVTRSGNPAKEQVMAQQLIVYFQDHYRVVDGFRDPETGLIDTGWLANELAGVNQFTPLVLPLVDGGALVLASLDGVVFEVLGG